MLGAIIGDIVGSRFEFNNHRSKEFELFTDECFVTDDSIMTLAVAKALMETEYFVEPDIRLSEHEHKYLGLLNDNTIRFMRGIGRRYPCC
ncbi:MAG TPA: ADP-ribosylglycohydrolase, partial [Clostridia bacterium]|nr:ADP-ribosylglycohydrolase [Clostridia bacterium]